MPDSALNDEAQGNNGSSRPLLRKDLKPRRRSLRTRVRDRLGYFELYPTVKRSARMSSSPPDHLRKRLASKNTDLRRRHFKEYRVMYLASTSPTCYRRVRTPSRRRRNGFYESLHWTQSYGTPRFLGQLHIPTPRHRAIVVSDESWKAARGPIVFNTIYNGETMTHASAKGLGQRFDDPEGSSSIKQAPEARLKAHMHHPPVMNDWSPSRSTARYGHYRSISAKKSRLAAYVRLERRRRPPDRFQIPRKQRVTARADPIPTRSVLRVDNPRRPLHLVRVPFPECQLAG
jgi:hypothetical protein